jgi:very-short-patch-repair endonuclease
LRARYSDAENKLWQALRRKQICGCRFRRQFPIGPYFADFVCLPARLLIEVDGGQHAEPDQKRHNLKRTEWLARQNFRVLRFWNGDVLKNTKGVVEVIAHAVRDAVD